jgi:Rhodopirellula transposase DDE domain
MAGAVETLGRRYEVLRPHLNELQRRLWLGVEAAQLGSGGVAIVAEATGVAADTVRRGRAQAEGSQAPDQGRSRKPGGGRKRAEHHDSELIPALEALIAPTTRGDPMSPLRWTCKSTRSLAAALTRAGHPVSDFVARRLLRQLEYSLQANAKTTEGAQHPDRDAQFGMAEPS